MSYLEYDTKHAQYGKVVILPQNVNQHAEGKFKTSRVVRKANASGTSTM